MTPDIPVYLDNNATTAVDPRVVEAMLPIFRKHYGNPASSTHRFGWYAEELVKIARIEIAELINCGGEEIVFTSGATEANNLAILGFVRAKRKENLGKAVHIVSVLTEHRSVLDPLEVLREEGVSVTLLPVTADGSIEPAVFAAAIRPETVLASVMLANNEIGTIHAIKDLSKITAARKIAFHCDASQAAGKIQIDVSAMRVEMLSLSAHKIYGPKGVGALYIRQGSVAAVLSPLLYGGGHEKGYRSGTLNVPGIVGFGAAAKIADKERAKDKVHVQNLATILFQELKRAFPTVQLNGPAENRLPGNLNVSFADIHNSRLIGQVSSKLAISASSACQSQSKTPSHVLQALGIDAARQRGSIRIGIGRFTTDEEVRFTAQILIDAVSKIRAAAR